MSSYLSTYTYTQSGTPIALAGIAKEAPSGVDVNCTPSPTAVITTTYTWFKLGDGCPGGYSYSGVQDGPSTCLWTSSRDILILTWNCLFTVTEAVSTVTLATSVSAGDRLTISAADTQYTAVTKTLGTVITATSSFNPPDKTVTITSTVQPPSRRQADRNWPLPKRLLSDVGPEANLTSHLVKKSCSFGQVLCDGGQCCSSGFGSCIASWSCCSEAFNCVPFSPSQPFEAAALYMYFVSSSTKSESVPTTITKEVIYSMATVVSTSTTLISVTGTQNTRVNMDLVTPTPTAAPASGPVLNAGGIVGVCIGAIIGLCLLAGLIFIFSRRFRRKKLLKQSLATKPSRTPRHPRNFPPPRSPVLGATSNDFPEPAPAYSFYEPIKLRDAAVQSEWEDRPLSMPLLSRVYGTLHGGGRSNTGPLGRRSNTVNVGVMGPDRQTRTSPRRIQTQTAMHKAQPLIPISSEPNGGELLAASRARRLQLETNVGPPQPTQEENERPSFLPAIRIPSPLQIQTPTGYTPNRTSNRTSIPRKSVGSGNSNFAPIMRSGLRNEVGTGQAPTISEVEKEIQKPIQTPLTSRTPSAIYAAYRTLLQQLEQEEYSKLPVSNPTRTPEPPPAASTSSPSVAQASQAQISNSTGDKSIESPLPSPPGASYPRTPAGPYNPKTSFQRPPPVLQIPNTFQSRPASQAHSLSPLTNTPSGHEVPSPLSPASPPTYSNSQGQTPIQTPYTPYRPNASPYPSPPISRFNSVMHPSSQSGSQRFSQPFSLQDSPRHSQNFSQNIPLSHANSQSSNQRLSQPPQYQQFLPPEQQEPGRVQDSQQTRQQEPDMPSPLTSPLPSMPALNGSSNEGGSGRWLGSVREREPYGAEGNGGDDDGDKGALQKSGSGDNRRGGSRGSGISRDSRESIISGGHKFDELPAGLPGFYGAY